MSIYAKLLQIQQKVNGLGKDKDTKSQYNPNGYAYVTGSKVLEHIKPLMNELGLLLKQEVLSIENSRQDYAVKSGTKSEILSKVMMRFTWVDCETGEKDENLFGANGQNDWEKGAGSALTYAERYFLLKYFHIPTDEDDIDNSDRKTAPPITTPTPVAKVTPTVAPKTEETKSALKPSTEFDKTDDSLERKTKAKELFAALDQASVLKYVIGTLKKKHTTVQGFIDNEPIELILETYTKLTEKK